ncbi:MAG: GNAT family N-acetyltransferase [Rhodobacteraceae bacterium]|nr:GNAT family N-acetyltransferase [Paracoccaceae bacterium]
MTLQQRLTPADGTVSDNLRLRIVQSLGSMTALRHAWEDLEQRDPEGTIFLSWKWMEQTFRAFPGRWRVLAVWAGGRLVCVLPLKYRVHWSERQNCLQTELEAAGRLNYSEYVGFLCDPAFEAGAIKLIADHLQTQPWNKLTMKYEASQNRADVFMSCFPDSRYEIEHLSYVLNGGETDNLLCPQVDLPDSYEEYLQEKPGKNMRQKIRRFTRKYLESGSAQITWLHGPAAEKGLDILLHFWLQKWVAIKGEGPANRVAESYRHTLMQADRQGLLRLPILWLDRRPVGALGHVLDPLHRRVHFIVTGRDENVPGNFIGPLLHSQSIRWAIENGYRTYDFAHGNEPYKHGYGAQDVRVNFFSVRPRVAAPRSAALDPICFQNALERLTQFLEAGDSKKALAVSRQLERLNRAGLKPT